MIAVNPMHMPSQYLWINLKGSLVVEITRDKFIEMLKNNFIFGRESKGILTLWAHHHISWLLRDCALLVTPSRILAISPHIPSYVLQPHPTSHHWLHSTGACACCNLRLMLLGDCDWSVVSVLMSVVSWDQARTKRVEQDSLCAELPDLPFRHLPRN